MLPAISSCRSLRAAAWSPALCTLLEAGKIKPVIYQTFPLADAVKAHALMESSSHVGKIVLELAHG